MAISGRTDRPLLLALLHQHFVGLASLEQTPSFLNCHLLQPSQGSVMGGVRSDNPNIIKNPYRIGILPVAVAVLFSVLVIGVNTPADVIILASNCIVIGIGQHLRYIPPLTRII